MGVFGCFGEGGSARVPPRKLSSPASLQGGRPRRRGGDSATISSVEVRPAGSSVSSVGSTNLPSQTIALSSKGALVWAHVDELADEVAELKRRLQEEEEEAARLREEVHYLQKGGSPSSGHSYGDARSEEDGDSKHVVSNGPENEPLQAPDPDYGPRSSAPPTLDIPDSPLHTVKSTEGIAKGEPATLHEDPTPANGGGFKPKWGKRGKKHHLIEAGAEGKETSLTGWLGKSESPSPMVVDVHVDESLGGPLTVGGKLPNDAVTVRAPVLSEEGGQPKQAAQSSSGSPAFAAKSGELMEARGEVRAELDEVRETAPLGAATAHLVAVSEREKLEEAAILKLAPDMRSSTEDVFFSGGVGSKRAAEAAARHLAQLPSLVIFPLPEVEEAKAAAPATLEAALSDGSEASLAPHAAVSSGFDFGNTGVLSQSKTSAGRAQTHLDKDLSGAVPAATSAEASDTKESSESFNFIVNPAFSKESELKPPSTEVPQGLPPRWPSMEEKPTLGGALVRSLSPALKRRGHSKQQRLQVTLDDAPNSVPNPLFKRVLPREGADWTASRTSSDYESSDGSGEAFLRNKGQAPGTEEEEVTNGVCMEAPPRHDEEAGQQQSGAGEEFPPRHDMEEAAAEENTTGGGAGDLAGLKDLNAHEQRWAAVAAPAADFSMKQQRSVVSSLEAWLHERDSEVKGQTGDGGSMAAPFERREAGTFGVLAKNDSEARPNAAADATPTPAPAIDPKDAQHHVVELEMPHGAAEGVFDSPAAAAEAACNADEQGGAEAMPRVSHDSDRATSVLEGLPSEPSSITVGGHSASTAGSPSNELLLAGAGRHRKLWAAARKLERIKVGRGRAGGTSPPLSLTSPDTKSSSRNPFARLAFGAFSPGRVPHDGVPGAVEQAGIAPDGSGHIVAPAAGAAEAATKSPPAGVLAPPLQHAPGAILALSLLGRAPRGGAAKAGGDLGSVLGEQPPAPGTSARGPGGVEPSGCSGAARSCCVNPLGGTDSSEAVNVGSAPAPPVTWSQEFTEVGKENFLANGLEGSKVLRALYGVDGPLRARSPSKHNSSHGPPFVGAVGGDATASTTMPPLSPRGLAAHVVQLPKPGGGRRAAAIMGSPPLLEDVAEELPPPPHTVSPSAASATEEGHLILASQPPAGTVMVAGTGHGPSEAPLQDSGVPPGRQGGDPSGNGAGTLAGVPEETSPGVTPRGGEHDAGPDLRDLAAEGKEQQSPPADGGPISRALAVARSRLRMAVSLGRPAPLSPERESTKPASQELPYDAKDLLEALPPSATEARTPEAGGAPSEPHEQVQGTRASPTRLQAAEPSKGGGGAWSRTGGRPHWMAIPGLRSRSPPNVPFVNEAEEGPLAVEGKEERLQDSTPPVPEQSLAPGTKQQSLPQARVGSGTAAAELEVDPPRLDSLESGAEARMPSSSPRNKSTGRGWFGPWRQKEGISSPADLLEDTPEGSPAVALPVSPRPKPLGAFLSRTLHCLSPTRDVTHSAEEDTAALEETPSVGAAQGQEAAIDEEGAESEGETHASLERPSVAAPPGAAPADILAATPAAPASAVGAAPSGPEDKDHFVDCFETLPESGSEAGCFQDTREELRRGSVTSSSAASLGDTDAGGRAVPATARGGSGGEEEVNSDGAPGLLPLDVRPPSSQVQASEDAVEKPPSAEAGALGGDGSKGASGDNPAAAGSEQPSASVLAVPDEKATEGVPVVQLQAHVPSPSAGKPAASATRNGGLRGWSAAIDGANSEGASPLHLKGSGSAKPAPLQQESVAAKAVFEHSGGIRGGVPAQAEREQPRQQLDILLAVPNTPKEQPMGQHEGGKQHQPPAAAPPITSAVREGGNTAAVGSIWGKDAAITAPGPSSKPRVATADVGRVRLAAPEACVAKEGPSLAAAPTDAAAGTSADVDRVAVPVARKTRSVRSMFGAARTGAAALGSDLQQVAAPWSWGKAAGSSLPSPATARDSPPRQRGGKDSPRPHQHLQQQQQQPQGSESQQVTIESASKSEGGASHVSRPTTLATEGSGPSVLLRAEAGFGALTLGPADDHDVTSALRPPPPATSSSSSSGLAGADAAEGVSGAPGGELSGATGQQLASDDASDKGEQKSSSTSNDPNRSSSTGSESIGSPSEPESGPHDVGRGSGPLTTAAAGQVAAAQSTKDVAGLARVHSAPPSRLPPGPSPQSEHGLLSPLGTAVGLVPHQQAATSPFFSSSFGSFAPAVNVRSGRQPSPDPLPASHERRAQRNSWGGSTDGAPPSPSGAGPAAGPQQRPWGLPGPEEYGVLHSAPAKQELHLNRRATPPPGSTARSYDSPSLHSPVGTLPLRSVSLSGPLSPAAREMEEITRQVRQSHSPRFGAMPAPLGRQPMPSSPITVRRMLPPQSLSPPLSPPTTKQPPSGGGGGGAGFPRASPEPLLLSPGGPQRPPPPLPLLRRGDSVPASAFLRAGGDKFGPSTPPAHARTNSSPGLEGPRSLQTVHGAPPTPIAATPTAAAAAAAPRYSPESPWGPPSRPPPGAAMVRPAVSWSKEGAATRPGVFHQPPGGSSTPPPARAPPEHFRVVKKPEVPFEVLLKQELARQQERKLQRRLATEGTTMSPSSSITSPTGLGSPPVSVPPLSVKPPPLGGRDAAAAAGFGNSNLFVGWRRIDQQKLGKGDASDGAQ